MPKKKLEIAGIDVAFVLLSEIFVSISHLLKISYLFYFIYSYYYSVFCSLGFFWGKDEFKANLQILLVTSS